MRNHLISTASRQRQELALLRLARLAVLLAVALAGQAVAPGAPRPVSAAPAALPFTVNNPLDVPADLLDNDYSVCRTANNNNICTLRAAIMKANRLAGGGATIIIPSGAYSLTIAPSGGNTDTTGDLNITQTVTIAGAGAANTVIDGGGTDRIFQIMPGASAAISGLTIRNGNTAGGGGAIYNYGTLTVTDSLVTGNSAIGNKGGGIYSEGPGLRLDHTIVSANTASYNGGGLYIISGIARLDQSIVFDNQGDDGGGIAIGVATVTLNNSTVTANIATEVGGGVFDFRGDVTLNNSTISANSANRAGGGIANAFGTGLGKVRLFHTTIAGNLADYTGATGYVGIYGGGGIFNDVTQTVELHNTLLAENYVSRTASDCSGNPLTSFNNNYIQSGLGCLSSPGANDLSGFDILLGPLQDNGGPTPTRALLTGSPALDQIPPDSACRDSYGTFPVPDQRGVPRPVNGLCDIGAYEGVQPFSYGRNLVRNGDAESGGGSPNGAFVGVPNWIVSNNGHFTTFRFDPNLFDILPANAGYNFLAGGDVPTDSLASQYLDVTPAGTAIDAGGVNYTFSADLGGVFDHANSASATATFQDVTLSNILGTTTLGPVTHTDRGDLSGLLHGSQTNPLPPGTRYILIKVQMTDAGANPNDAYADNVSFVLRGVGTLYLPLLRR